MLSMTDGDRCWHGSRYLGKLEPLVDLLELCPLRHQLATTQLFEYLQYTAFSIQILSLNVILTTECQLCR
ncbi:hypothetical protein RJT34_16994 [Clitoria ternatea]|uniref:Uncharacterized protein n=1 Tax=Clitoria ternatea TaxID=43366 RepID=A0AAN9PDC5_CLITE